MLNELMLLVTLLAPPVGDTPTVDKARISAAVAQLDKAFKSGESADRVRAIDAAKEIPDGEVAAGIGKGLRDKDATVQKAAIEALRFLGHPAALKELQETIKHEKAKDDLPRYAALMHAIGQYGDVSSIKIFTDDVWGAPDAAVIEARILGLGNIKKHEAIEEIIGLMKVAGRDKTDPFMKDFRLALWALTGADQAGSLDLWMRWWQDNKEKIKVLTTPPAEPKDLAHRWRTYWAKPGDESDKDKREEAGGKGEKGKAGKGEDGKGEGGKGGG